MGRGRRRQDDDREVPEVDAVGAHPDPAQRPPAEDRAEPGGGVGQRRDDEDARHREQHEAALVEEGGVLVGAPDQQGDAGQAGDAGAVEQAAGARRDPGPQPAARPDHRQGGAGEQLEGAGVGPVVDPRGVEAGVVEEGHGGGRGDRQGQRRDGQPRAHTGGGGRDLAHEADPEQQQEGPDDVELLLHPQRPEVVERRGRAEAGEVGDVLEDQPPVADVERRRGHRFAERHRLGPAGDRDPGHDHHEHREEGGQEAPRPPQPEAGQPPAPARPLREQDVRDQVAAQGEEDPDAQEPARSPPEAQVIGDHGEHGHGTQPVQPRHVALAAPCGLRHGSQANADWPAWPDRQAILHRPGTGPASGLAACAPGYRRSRA